MHIVTNHMTTNYIIIIIIIIIIQLVVTGDSLSNFISPNNNF